MVQPSFYAVLFHINARRWYMRGRSCQNNWFPLDTWQAKQQNSVYPNNQMTMNALLKSTFRGIGTLRSSEELAIRKFKGCILKGAQQKPKSTYTNNPTSLLKYLAPREGEQAFTQTVDEESHEGDEVLTDFGFYPRSHHLSLNHLCLFQTLLISFELLRAVQCIN